MRLCALRKFFYVIVCIQDTVEEVELEKVHKQRSFKALLHAEQSNIDVPVHNVTDNHETSQGMCKFFLALFEGVL